MKISELIRILQNAKESNGDLELVVMQEPEVYSIVEQAIVTDKSNDREAYYSNLPQGNYAHISLYTKEDMNI